MKVARVFPLMAAMLAWSPQAVVSASLLGGCALFTGGTTADDAEVKTTPRHHRRRSTMTTAVVEKHGAKVFARPYAEVFEACKDALLARGYTIAVAKPKRGLIISGRLSVGRETATLGVVLSEDSARVTETTVTYSRQYTLHLKRVAPGRTWVAAVPAVYAGSHDISGRVRWNLYGQFGERSRWKQLFAKIRELLPERTPAPGPRRQRPIPPPAD